LVKKPVRLGLEELESRLAPAATLSIATANVIEPGPNGTANMDFTVTRSGDVSTQLTVGYTTVPGTAQANLDFTPVTGSATFAAGSSTAVIQIPVFGSNAYKASNLNFSVQLTGASVVGGPVAFATKTDFGAGTSPVSVTVADFNGDGKPDLAVVNAGDNTVSVLLNTTLPGAASPTFAVQQTFLTGTQPSSVISADINLDGRPDLVVANNGASGSLSVLLNTTPTGSATLSFATHFDFASGANSIAVAAGDLNGDGKPDLVVANFGSNNVSVFLNTTAPGAAAPSLAPQQTFATGTQPSAVVVADLNGDGRADIAVADNNSAGAVSVLFNKTTPGASVPAFASHVDFSVGSGPTSIAAGDLNGDGVADLVTDNSGSGNVSVLLDTTAPGAAFPSFASHVDFAAGAGAAAVALGDLNGDGKLDLAVADGGAGANTVSVLLNTTMPGATLPTFATPQTFASGAGPSAVVLANVNGDGKPDLVSANQGANTVSVLLNTSVLVPATSAFPRTSFPASSSLVAAVADINGDGKPDLVVGNNHGSTLTVVLNTTPPGAMTPSFAAPVSIPAGTDVHWLIVADLNGDGKPDVVVDNYYTNGVSVLMNQTVAGALVPSFGSPVGLGSGIGAAAVIGDINRDGKPDLVVTKSSAGQIGFYLNTTPTGAAAPSFAPVQSITLAGRILSVALADLNGDGSPDITVGSDANISVLLNNTPPGAATVAFAAPKSFTTTGGIGSIIAADFNGDGKLDLALNNQPTIYVNTTPPGSNTVSFIVTPVGSGGDTFGVQDINGDGKPDLIVSTPGSSTKVVELLNTTTPGATKATFAAPVALPTGQPNDVVLADLNGDGRPDIILPSQYGTDIHDSDHNAGSAYRRRARNHDGRYGHDPGKRSGADGDVCRGRPDAGAECRRL
jgi:hypothetical protein